MVASRYLKTKMIAMSVSWGNQMSYNKRWQVSFVDEKGSHYDFFFVCKPTRKQIRNLIRSI
ncbi:hypothetical protein [Klebsiella phage MY01]|nr:hypothetical protein [Pseudomonas phage MY01]